MAIKLIALNFSLVRWERERQQSTTESGQFSAQGKPTGKTNYEKHLSFSDYYCPSLDGFNSAFLGGSACKGSRNLISTAVPSTSFRLVPRSAESMLRFLGHVVRSELAPPSDHPAWTAQIFSARPRRKGLQPLFLVTHDGRHGRAVFVSDDGTEYVIPTSGGGLSMLALSLFSTFFGMHQSAINLPTSPTVNLLNQ